MNQVKSETYPWKEKVSTPNLKKPSCLICRHRHYDAWNVDHKGGHRPETQPPTQIHSRSDSNVPERLAFGSSPKPVQKHHYMKCAAPTTAQPPPPNKATPGSTGRNKLTVREVVLQTREKTHPKGKLLLGPAKKSDKTWRPKCQERRG
jgi:hypothetical protein